MPAETRTEPFDPVRRIIVNIHPAQRELVEDLSAVGPRYRAERLRSLALIGLAVLRGGVGTAHRPEIVLAPPPESPPTSDPQLSRRLRLLNCVAPDE
jgi:hypothetical protein